MLGIALAAAAISASVLPWVRFDFNPFHLEDQHAEAVSTSLELMRDPDLTPNSLEVVSPSLGAANTLAARLHQVPAVETVRTLSNFIPDDQAPKLAIIADTEQLLGLSNT